MGHPFREEVDRLHELAADLVGGALREDVYEIFAESRFREHLTLSVGRRGRHEAPSELSSLDERSGVGLRRIGRGGPHFAVVDGLGKDAVRAAAAEVFGPATSRTDRYARQAGELRRENSGGAQPFDGLSGSLDLPADVADAVSRAEKRHLLEAAVDAALSLEPNLQEIEVSLQASVRRVCVWATDIQPCRTATSHVAIRVFASTPRASTHAVGGAPTGIGHFLIETPESIAKTCIERLHALQEVQPEHSVRGTMPVVLEGGWGGVWLHETVGHLLEADTRSPHGRSALGTRIGDERITVVDDGTLDGGRGSCTIDDEGMTTRRTILIEEGVLRNLMSDRQTARRQGLPRTGNGRRQDYRHAPLPRMTNLLLEEGSDRPSDLIADVEHGLYVRTIGNGEVRPDEDRFTFDVLEGYAIDKGRIAAPVPAVRISGKPSEILRRVRGVADDFALDPARGACVKAGQTVPVSVGMPTVLFEKLDVVPLA